MDYKTRKELNQLSKAVFGSTSKWQKFVNNGEAVPVTETVRVLNGETKKLRKNNANSPTMAQMAANSRNLKLSTTPPKPLRKE